MNLDLEYINRCKISPQYYRSIPRGLYKAEHVTNFKKLFYNCAVEPRAWIPIEVHEAEIKRIKLAVTKGVQKSLDTIKPNLM